MTDASGTRNGTADEAMEEGRVLRITIPVRQHIQLHKLRLLVGKNMSDVVSEALDMYFAAFNGTSEDAAADDSDGAQRGS